MLSQTVPKGLENMSTQGLGKRFAQAQQSIVEKGGIFGVFLQKREFL